MNKFESYDYLKVTVEETRLSHYIDGYECFGWKLDPNIPLEVNGAKAVVHFKRSRAILNKVELTRLQSHFERGNRSRNFGMCICCRSCFCCYSRNTNNLAYDPTRNSWIYPMGSRISDL